MDRKKKDAWNDSIAYLINAQTARMVPTHKEKVFEFYHDYFDRLYNHSMQPFQRRSIRLPGYDYTQSGFYFITILAGQRLECFGEIINGAMQENPLGRMVRREWLFLAQRFLNSEIDEFIVMPNHFHGILALIDDPRGVTSPAHEAFGQPVRGSIPTIVRSFKAAATLRARRMLGDSLEQLWQRNYFERVIQDERGLEAARLYIRENPIHWAEDHENPSRGK